MESEAVKTLKLESVKKENYSGDYDGTVLEQWKTCVDMANNNTEKRSNSNNIYITINAALLAVISFSLDLKSIILAVVGIVICVLWIKTIKSYKTLSTVKYGIVNEIEKKLPLRPYTYEWDKLEKEYKYPELTSIEKAIPWLFIILFSVSFIIPVIKFIIDKI